VNEDDDNDHAERTRNHSTEEEATVPGIHEGLADDDLVKNRIMDLVACHSPLDVSNLPKLYQDAFRCTRS